MSIHLKFIRARRRNIKVLRLNRLKRIVDSEDNDNPISLLRVLLDGQPLLCNHDNDKKRFIVMRTFMKVLKFIGQVMLVIGLLYIAAIIFAYLEDEASHNESNIPETNTSNSNSSSKLWISLEDHYDLKLRDIDRKSLDQILSKGIEGIKMDQKHAALEDGNRLSHLKVQKWFYFVVIASTTIGYGDVTPKSQNGKIFYCCFSVIGIILMMSLLNSSGALISTINRRFYWFIRYYLFEDIKEWSEESVSLILTLCLFSMFLTLGIWHDSIDDNYHYGLTDTIYFWVTSFTTVGFGDIGHSLEFEIQHAYELTVYRVFGLSLVAAIINCILSCADLQRKTIQRETEVYQRKIIERVKLAVEKANLFQHRSRGRVSVVDGLKQAVVSGLPLTSEVAAQL